MTLFSGAPHFGRLNLACPPKSPSVTNEIIFEGSLTLPKVAVAQSIRVERLGSETKDFAALVKDLMNLNEGRYHALIENPYSEMSQVFLEERQRAVYSGNKTIDTVQLLHERVRALVLAQPHAEIDRQIARVNNGMPLEQRAALRASQHAALTQQLTTAVKTQHSLLDALDKPERRLCEYDNASLWDYCIDSAFGSTSPSNVSSTFGAELQRGIRLATVNVIQDREAVLELGKTLMNDGETWRGLSPINPKTFSKFLGINLRKEAYVEILPFAVVLYLHCSDHLRLDRHLGLTEFSSAGLNISSPLPENLRGRVCTVSAWGEEVKKGKRTLSSESVDTRAHELKHALFSGTNSCHRFESYSDVRAALNRIDKKAAREGLSFEQELGCHQQISRLMLTAVREANIDELVAYGVERQRLNRSPPDPTALGSERWSRLNEVVSDYLLGRLDLSSDQRQEIQGLYREGFRRYLNRQREFTFCVWRLYNQAEDINPEQAEASVRFSGTRINRLYSALGATTPETKSVIKGQQELMLAALCKTYEVLSKHYSKFAKDRSELSDWSEMGDANGILGQALLKDLAKLPVEKSISALMLTLKYSLENETSLLKGAGGRQRLLELVWDRIELLSYRIAAYYPIASVPSLTRVLDTLVRFDTQRANEHDFRQDLRSIHWILRAIDPIENKSKVRLIEDCLKTVYVYLKGARGNKENKKTRRFSVHKIEQIAKEFNFSLVKKAKVKKAKVKEE